jgi:hypothetical protein
MKHSKRRKYFKNDNNNDNNQLLPYERNITDNLDDVHYRFYQYMNKNDLKKVRRLFKFQKIYSENNKDNIQIEKTEHTRKKTFVYDLNGNVT